MYVKFLIKKDGEWVNIPKVLYPMTEEQNIENTLDTAVFTSVDHNPNLFKRWSKIKVIKELVKDQEEGAETREYFGDDYIESISVSDWYKHHFICYEPTKWFERFFISGKCVTQSTSNPKSLKNVVQELFLDIKERYNVQFLIDTDTANSLDKVVSPEFKWYCKATLWECLEEVGDKIDARPRLINFDTLIYQSYSNVKDNVEEILYRTGYEMDRPFGNYAKSLETFVENCICEDSIDEASVVFPSASGWMTPRCEEYKRTDGNSRIILPFRIERILKANVEYLGAGDVKAIIIDSNGNTYNGIIENHLSDISNNIVEFNEWSALSQTTEIKKGKYKNNCIYYTKGENIIDLAGKYVTSGLYNTYSIFEAIGTSFIGKTVTIKYTDGTLGETKYATGTVQSVEVNGLTNPNKVLFRIEYIPYVNGKRQTVKITDSIEGSLTYNQSIETVNSQAVGKKMWSQMCRQDTDIIKVSATIKKLEDIKKLGDIYNGYIITSIKTTYNSMYAMNTVYTMCKDYQRLSEFVKLNKEYRKYKIPEASIIDKHIQVNEYCIISDNNNQIGEATCFTEKGIKQFAKLFAVDYSDYDEITEINNAVYRGRKDSEVTDDLLLSSTSLSFAKSIMFDVRMVDNYSAGKQVVSSNECKDVPYSIEGELTGFNIVLTANFDKIMSSTQCDLLPVIDGDYNPNSLYERDIYIPKDPGETIDFTAQLHFVTDDSNIIIGDALASDSSLIKSFDTIKVNKFGTISEGKNIGESLDDYPGYIIVKVVSEPIEGSNTFVNYYYTLSNHCLKLVLTDKKLNKFSQSIDDFITDNCSYTFTIDKEVEGDVPKINLNLNFGETDLSLYRAWALLDMNNDIVIAEKSLTAVNNGLRTISLRFCKYLKKYD